MLYKTIYADPPWMLKGGKSGKSGWSSSASPDAHYNLMKTEDIASLPVKSMAEDNSCLFLWVVNGLLPCGLDVMSRWGYRYINNMCWRKTTGYGIGQYIRGEHELCLFGVRGKPGYNRDELGKRTQVRSVVDAPRGRHSEKPEEMRRRIQLISSGPYLELFARKSIPGWDVWGNEVKNNILIEQPLSVVISI
jgi:N6-adenosine-specific RNA methylase IME4